MVRCAQGCARGYAVWNMSIVIPKPEHEVVYKELSALVSKHAHEVDALVVLAIAANMVGKLIAMQDQRKHTTDKIMHMVGQNIEMGNQQVLAELMGEAKGNG
jgi:hypothetical protein